MHDFHHAPLRDVDAPTLYRLLWLRVSVFVVEQAAAYPELDGRDLEPTTELFWVTAPDDEVLATLRLLDDGDAMRIGRVATSPSARGAGVAAELMRRAIALSTRRQPNHAIRLDAQTHVAPWYARFGFAVAGPAFEEDGIPHVPMTREPPAVTGPADA